MEISLRETEDRDLPIFWDYLTDPEMLHMAAATRKYRYKAGYFRVLEKSGFIVTGRGRSFARARGQEIDVMHWTLS